jgi:hypothetical protein
MQIVLCPVNPQINNNNYYYTDNITWCVIIQNYYEVISPPGYSAGLFGRASAGSNASTYTGRQDGQCRTSVSGLLFEFTIPAFDPSRSLLQTGRPLQSATVIVLLLTYTLV